MTATTVKLGGVLGKRFGREFTLHLESQTPAEAVRALCAMIDGFKAFLAGAGDRGIEFAVWRGAGRQAENIGYDQLREPAGGVIRIVPVHSGAKSGGVLQTIIGVVLIVVGIIGNIYGGWGTPFIQVGVAMVAGGVVQMLSPQPKLNKAADAADNQGSYVFNGPVNTTAQGGCIPLFYGGPMEIGSVVLSAGIDAVDYSSRPSNVGSGTAGGNSKTNPLDD